MEEGAGEVRELGGWGGRRVGRKVGLEGWVIELDIRGLRVYILPFI